jgi:hypothetical protein
MKPFNAKLKNELRSWNDVQELINFLFYQNVIKTFCRDSSGFSLSPYDHIRFVSPDDGTVI